MTLQSIAVPTIRKIGNGALALAELNPRFLSIAKERYLQLTPCWWGISEKFSGRDICNISSNNDGIHQ